MMNSRILLLVLCIGLTGSGCHLVQPLFSKPGSSPPVKPAPSTPAAIAPAGAKGSGNTKTSPVTTRSAGGVTSKGLPQPRLGSGKHMAENGVRASEDLLQVQNPPELLHAKYAV